MSHSGPGRRPYRRSPLSAGLQWASVVTTIGLEMALPPLLGAWIDSSFGTSPLWTVLLACVGFVVAMRHLWDLSKRISAPAKRAGKVPSTESQDEAKDGRP